MSDYALLLRYHLAVNAISLSSLAKQFGCPLTTIQRGFAEQDSQFLSQVADFTAFNPSKYSLQDALSCEEACRQWSKGHGALLLELITSAGHTLNSFASLGITSKASLVRWTSASIRPRTVGLAPVLYALGASPSMFDSIEVNLGDKVGEDLNSFAYALLNLLNDSSMTRREFFSVLNLPCGDLQAWLEGRGFPTGQAKERLEYALSVTVERAKSEVKVAKEVFTGASKLSRLIFDERVSRGWTVQDLASKMGADVTTVEKLTEVPSKPVFSTLRKLADALELDYDIVSLAAFGPQPDKTFSERLRALRVSRLISSHEMANLLGVAHFVYARYEMPPTKKDPMRAFPTNSKGRLEKMAEVLGVEVEDLLPTDPKAFGSWLDAMILSDSDRRAVSLLCSVPDEEVARWLEGEVRPTFKQAKTLARFFGASTLSVRTLISG